jgi:hypothetical protein
MSGDAITVSLVSLWMGFAVALQIQVQTRADAQARQQGQFGWRFIVARLIYSVIGIAGMLGVASLMGSFQAFRGAVFTVSFGLGIAAFVVTAKLGEAKNA